MDESLQAIATILALVNPAICVAMFTQSVGGEARATKLREAVRATVVIAVILAVAALAGPFVLDLFGLSLDAFACAGGGILAWIGAGMIRQGGAGDAPRSDSATEPTSLTPLILFAASPGTLTGIITVAAAHSSTRLPVTALVAVGVTCVVLLAALSASAWFGHERAPAGLGRQIVTSYMGVIVVAMGVQFALTGLRSFFATPLP